LAEEWPVSAAGCFQQKVATVFLFKTKAFIFVTSTDILLEKKTSQPWKKSSSGVK
jgi:hypothetical protein